MLRAAGKKGRGFVGTFSQRRRRTLVVSSTRLCRSRIPGSPSRQAATVCANLPTLFLMGDIYLPRDSRRGRCTDSPQLPFPVLPFALFPLFLPFSFSLPLFPLRRHVLARLVKANGSGSLFPRQKPQPKFEINNAPACPNRIPYRSRVIVIERSPMVTNRADLYIDQRQTD